MILDTKMMGTVGRKPVLFDSKRATIGWSLLPRGISGHLIEVTFVCLLCLYPQICLAQKSGEAYEYEAKVALIYNSSKFTTWPEEAFKDAEAPFVFAILGETLLAMR